MPALTRNGVEIVSRVEVAARFHERFFGLMCRRRPGPGYGLYFPRCRGLHTWFMLFPLDVIFLDAGGRVIRVVRNVRPWRLVWGGARAADAIEVEAGWLPPDAAATGDRLTLASPP